MGRDEAQDRSVEPGQLVVSQDVLQDPAEGDGAASQRDEPGGQEDPGGAFRAKPPQEKSEGGAVAVPERLESRIVPQASKKVFDLLWMRRHPPSGSADDRKGSS